MSGWEFPKPLPDELGYGLVARYFAQWSDLDRRGVLDGLTQRRIVNTHPATVPGLTSIAQAAFPNEEHPVPIFVRRHTLLTYVMAFAPQEKQQRILTTISQKKEDSIQRLSLTSSRHCWPRTMQLCPACLQDDIGSARTPYWRRTHHMPGIAHCLRHGRRLHTTSRQFAYAPAAAPATPLSVLCKFSAESEVKPLFNRCLERTLIDPSLAALKGKLVAPLSGSVAHYRKLIRNIDRTRSSIDTLDFSGVHWTFTHWLKQNGCEESSLGPKDWLRPLLTNVQGTPSTLQHLLLRAFLAAKRPWTFS